MKTYYGNYLGLVVDDKDPQQRGRVKIFIPHIMPALYNDWNKEGKDISFNITDGGLPTGLNTDVVSRLQKMLPWAECAAPIFGAGPAGIFNYETGKLDAAALNRGNGAFGQSDGIAGLGDETPLAYVGEDLPYSRKYEIAGDGSLASSDKLKIILHDTGESVANGQIPGWLTSGEDGGQPGKGTYNYIVTGGKIYSTTTEGTASYYGVRGANSTSISIAWVGPFGGTPNAEDRAALAKIISYVSAKNNIPKSRIQTHGDVQSDKVGDASGWASTVVGALGKLNENPSSDESKVADANTKTDLTKETGEIINDDEDLPDLTQEQMSALASEATGESAEAGAQANEGSSSATISTRFTAYSPQASGSSSIGLEGGYASSKAGPDGQAVVRTLQDVASGNSSYVTLAGDPSTYGQNYTIPSITFTNASGQTQTLTNVLGVVHDTGSAFTGAGTSKFDVAVDKDLTAAQINSQSFLANDGSITLAAADEATVAAAKNSPVIQNPAGTGTTFVNTNYMPTGMFGSARAGQMVWVFFQEGDPLYPVYFAASYGKKEWANVKQHSSPDKVKKVKTKEDTLEDPLQGSQTTLSLNAGGFKDVQWISGQPSGFEQDEFAFQVYGKNGSNLSFTFHTTLLNSKYDFRQHTQGDAHYITSGNRTDRTTGDHTIVCEQDQIITIGNWSQEALQASNNIQKVLDRAMKAAKDTYEK